MYKRSLLAIILFITVLTSSFASAAEIMPRADLYFDSAYPVLNSDQSVTFNATTYDIYSRISVLAVWLEKKVDGEWSYECYLTTPTAVATDTFVYCANVDYSSQIGTGTFRVWATFNADGYEITRCSNERTFN